MKCGRTRNRLLKFRTMIRDFEVFRGRLEDVDDYILGFEKLQIILFDVGWYTVITHYAKYI